MTDRFDLILGSGQKLPSVRRGANLFAIFLEHLRSVILGIDRDGDKFDIRRLSSQALDSAAAIRLVMSGHGPAQRVKIKFATQIFPLKSAVDTVLPSCAVN